MISIQGLYEGELLVFRLISVSPPNFRDVHYVISPFSSPSFSSPNPFDLFFPVTNDNANPPDHHPGRQ